MIRVPLILNPAAGGGRLLRALGAAHRAAARSGHELEIWSTHGPGHATELAGRAADRGEPLVLAFGGDGTYNEVARGLVGSSTSLGVVPGGTTSVLAYELDVPRPAPHAVAALLASALRLRKSAVSVVAGHGSPQKRVAVTGLRLDEIERRLAVS